MTDSPAEIVQQLLIDRGLGTDPANNVLWPVFSTTEPDAPDQVITVTDTAGTSSGRTMPDGALLGPFGFQIRVRSREHSQGWVKADSIRQSLAQDVYQANVMLSASGKNYIVQAIVKIGDVLPLGKELPTSQRSLFTLNAQVVVKQLN